MKKCKICNRKGKILFWLKYVGYTNLFICKECDESLKEQLGDDYLPFYTERGLRI